MTYQVNVAARAERDLVLVFDVINAERHRKEGSSEEFVGDSGSGNLPSE
jgi:hypothetical protein